MWSCFTAGRNGYKSFASGRRGCSRQGPVARGMRNLVPRRVLLVRRVDGMRPTYRSSKSFGARLRTRDQGERTRTGSRPHGAVGFAGDPFTRPDRRSGGGGRGGRDGGPGGPRGPGAVARADIGRSPRQRRPESGMPTGRAGRRRRPGCPSGTRTRGAGVRAECSRRLSRASPGQCGQGFRAQQAREPQAGQEGPVRQAAAPPDGSWPAGGRRGGPRRRQGDLH